MNIRKKLIEEADEKYKKYSEMLNPNANNILGVRLPILRKLAKEIYKTSNWKTFISTKSIYMEETMLKGMIIGLINENTDVILKYVEDFIPQISNWAICDSFCSSLKFIKNSKEKVWNFIQNYVLSDDEFQSRFAFVIMLNYFVENKYITLIFDILNQYKNKNYYSQMAVAWLVSICYIKFPNKTESFLNKTQLDDFTFKKAIQKIGESNRINRNSHEFKRLQNIR